MAAAEPTSAAEQAAIAAAEAIAAEAAAGIAAEAAAVAAEVVAAAALAAAKASARANRTAAQAAAEIAAVAQAAAATASAAAVVASASVDHTGAQAVADIAEAARKADDVVHAATAAAAQSANRARVAATETADELALEAVAVAADVVTAAAAAAAKVIEAGDAAAQLVLATAAALRMPVPRGAELSRDATRQAPRLGAAMHTEWASVLADPVMPRDWAASEPLTTVVSAASPAEQGLWRDISLARRMQAALRASEAQFEAAFGSAPTAMLIATLEDGAPVRFTQVNQALAELTGWAKSELLGFGFADLTHAEHRILEKDLARPAVEANAQPVERVRRWVHADGHAMWVRIRMAELATSTARKAELVCQVEDVTAQVAADASFSTSEARFRLAFVGAPQPAVLIQLIGNCPGRVLAVNQAACTLFGRNEVEMSWLDLESLTKPAERLAIVDLLDRFASGDVACHEGTYGYQTAAGHPGELEISAHAVDGPNGLPTQLVAHLRDATEPSPEQAFVFDSAWARALDL